MVIKSQSRKRSASRFIHVREIKRPKRVRKKNAKATVEKEDQNATMWPKKATTRPMKNLSKLTVVVRKTSWIE